MDTRRSGVSRTGSYIPHSTHRSHGSSYVPAIILSPPKGWPAPLRWMPDDKRDWGEGWEAGVLLLLLDRKGATNPQLGVVSLPHVGTLSLATPVTRSAPPPANDTWLRRCPPPPQWPQSGTTRHIGWLVTQCTAGYPCTRPWVYPLALEIQSLTLESSMWTQTRQIELVNKLGAMF